MNLAVYQAASHAGCTDREARAIATYADSETLEEAAQTLRVSSRWMLILLRKARARVDAPHNVAFLGLLMERPAGHWSKHEHSTQQT